MVKRCYRYDVCPHVMAATTRIHPISRLSSSPPLRACKDVACNTRMPHQLRRRCPPWCPHSNDPVLPNKLQYWRSEAPLAPQRPPPGLYLPRPPTPPSRCAVSPARLPNRPSRRPRRPIHPANSAAGRLYRPPGLRAAGSGVPSGPVSQQFGANPQARCSPRVRLWVDPLLHLPLLDRELRLGRLPGRPSCGRWCQARVAARGFGPHAGPQEDVGLGIWLNNGHHDDKQHCGAEHLLRRLWYCTGTVVAVVGALCAGSYTTQPSYHPSACSME